MEIIQLRSKLKQNFDSRCLKKILSSPPQNREEIKNNTQNLANFISLLHLPHPPPLLKITHMHYFFFSGSNE